MRSGVGMVNAPGTIDAAYRGEISVNLINHDLEAPVTLNRGDRIAQLVVQKWRVPNLCRWTAFLARSGAKVALARLVGSHLWSSVAQVFRQKPSK